MQLTLSLTSKTHMFIRDDKLFFKLYKHNQFSDKKDYSVVNAVPIDQIEAIHKWTGEIINARRTNPVD